MSPGQVRPDLAQDRREANDKSLRHQARAGEVPLPKSDEPSAKVATQNQLPIDVKSKTPIPKEIASRTLLPDAHAEPEARQPTTTASRADHPTTDILEQRVLAGKDAAKNLSQLTQGTKAAAATLGQKIVAASQSVSQAASSAAQLLPKALVHGASKVVEGKKPPLPMTAPKTMTAATGTTPAGLGQPADRAGEASRSATQTGDDAQLAAAIAQRAPSPFAAEPRVEGKEKSEASERGGINTDEAAANALDDVVTGRPVTAVAPHGFSAGSHYGGFGDTEGESAGLAQKVGTIPILPIILDGTEEAVETLALYASLGLSRVLYGADELLRRAIPIDQRIANARDDVPLSERLTDAGFLEQVAFGSRGSVLGPGNVIG